MASMGPPPAPLAACGAGEGGSVGFVETLRRALGEPGHQGLLYWDTSGASFHIADPPRLARELLPHMYGHASLASFVRQLYVYGFRKVPALPGRSAPGGGDHQHLHFHHRSFHRHRPQDLHLVTRKTRQRRPKAASVGSQLKEASKRPLGGQPLPTPIGQAPGGQPSTSAFADEGLMDEALSEVAALSTEQNSWDHRLADVTTASDDQRRFLASLQRHHRDQSHLITNLYALLEDVDASFRAPDPDPQAEGETAAKRLRGSEDTTELLEALAQELRMAVPLEPLPSELRDAVPPAKPANCLAKGLPKPASAPALSTTKQFQAFLTRVQTSLTALQSRLSAHSSARLRELMKPQPEGTPAEPPEEEKAEEKAREKAEEDGDLGGFGSRLSEVFQSLSALPSTEDLQLQRLETVDLESLTAELLELDDGAKGPGGQGWATAAPPRPDSAGLPSAASTPEEDAARFFFL